MEKREERKGDGKGDDRRGEGIKKTQVKNAEVNKDCMNVMDNLFVSFSFSVKHDCQSVTLLMEVHL